jgi:uracil-DNA glycosylase
MNKLDQLNALKAEYSKCSRCPLAAQGRSQVVFGHGNPEAKLMFIGEAPGKDEDLSGRPFIGRAGKILTSIIESMGLSRNDVYISNVAKCRPPNNRPPTAGESAACKELLLMKEIEIIQPQIICTLGNTATQALLGKESAINVARGQFHAFNNVLVLPTYHPAYLLRSPSKKAIVLDDMKIILAKLREREFKTL